MNLPPELEFEIVNALRTIGGWTEPPKALAIAELILETRPAIGVEIGVFFGRSLQAAAMAMRHNGVAARMYGIDPFRTEPCLEGENDPRGAAWWSAQDLDAICRACMDGIYRGRLEAWATLIRAESRHAADLFAPESIGYLHIDGAHSEIASVRDVMMFLPLVSRNAYIVMDDVLWPSTQKACAILSEQCEAIREVGDPAGNYCRIYRKR